MKMSLDFFILKFYLAVMQDKNIKINQKKKKKEGLKGYKKFVGRKLDTRKYSFSRQNQNNDIINDKPITAGENCTFF